MAALVSPRRYPAFLRNGGQQLNTAPPLPIHRISECGALDNSGEDHQQRFSSESTVQFGHDQSFTVDVALSRPVSLLSAARTTLFAWLHRASLFVYDL